MITHKIVLNILFFFAKFIKELASYLGYYVPYVIFNKYVYNWNSRPILLLLNRGSGI